MRLRPQNLIQAAEADLKRREHNELVDAGVRFADMEQYAFHRKHVIAATNARELLLLALMDWQGVRRKKALLWTEKTAKADHLIGTVRSPAGALVTNKKNTKLIYGDGGLLVDALRMIERTKDGV